MQDGAILHYGRGRRWFSPHQKLALSYRDRICACGCGLPAKVVYAAHLIAWEDHGLTNIDNAVPRCRTTHARKTAEENHRRRVAARKRLQELREERGTRPLPTDSPPTIGTTTPNPPWPANQTCPLTPVVRTPETWARPPTETRVGTPVKYYPGEQRY